MSKERKLKSYVEAWKYLRTEHKNDLTVVRKYDNVVNFLNQPLTLGIFIPCGEDGEPLRHPDELKGTYTNSKAASKYRQRYQQAKERVIFEGFDVKFTGKDYIVKRGGEDIWLSWNDSKKVIDIIHRELILTPSKYNELFK